MQAFATTIVNITFSLIFLLKLPALNVFLQWPTTHHDFFFFFFNVAISFSKFKSSLLPSGAEIH